ncbi:hypothetical protein PIB30_046459 [Stylosanthes scabra]|uniref:Uncharacterized protein n=1 Tax=Stylosanthes scabra TaxID=79078 RepID=A0ABU6SH32_9FABA|nr:hypothetical protein [Stylosanthes scabra]
MVKWPSSIASLRIVAEIGCVAAQAIYLTQLLSDSLLAFNIVTHNHFNTSGEYYDLFIKITANGAADHMAKHTISSQHQYTEWLHPWRELSDIIVQETSRDP